METGLSELVPLTKGRAKGGGVRGKQSEFGLRQVEFESAVEFELSLSQGLHRERSRRLLDRTAWAPARDPGCMQRLRILTMKQRVGAGAERKSPFFPQGEQQGQGSHSIAFVTNKVLRPHKNCKPHWPGTGGDTPCNGAFWRLARPILAQSLPDSESGPRYLLNKSPLVEGVWLHSHSVTF